MSLIFRNDSTQLFYGDCLELIENLPNDLIQCVITSPTYWGKRNFTDDVREFGSESLEDYVKKNVEIYSKILEKMKKSGSLFFVIQDSFMGSGISRSHHNHWENNKNPEYIRDGLDSTKQGNTSSVTAHHSTIKKKSLCGIPFRIANQLVDAGYIWRELIIWEKPNPMPENVKDRLRQSCEYILHFVKNRIYTFNQKPLQVLGQNGKYRMANQVLIASPEPRKGHTATFPRKIVEKLLLATTNSGDTVFEPFLGYGTMYYLSSLHNRNFIGVDICKDFVYRLANEIKSNKVGGLDKYLKKTKPGALDTYINENSNRPKKSAIEKKKKLEFFQAITDNLIKSVKAVSTNGLTITKFPKLKHEGKKYQFRALFINNGKKIAFEIPSIKNFDDKSTGPYYAAKRLKEAITYNLINMGLLIVPLNTFGNRYQEIIDNCEQIKVVKLTNDTAKKIVNGKNIAQISEFIEMNNIIIEAINH